MKHPQALGILPQRLGRASAHGAGTHDADVVPFRNKLHPSTPVDLACAIAKQLAAVSGDAFRFEI